ncbi:MAG TPA: hypothetical protein VIK69_09630, partial [Methylophilaceae bacterium]
LPPLPSGNVAHLIAAQAAEIEALRAERDALKAENERLHEQLRLALRDAAPAVQGEPIAWPLASPEEAGKGWTLDYRFLEQVERIASQHTDYTTSMEATEQVLIAANVVLRASQPADEELRRDAARYRWLREECKSPIGGLTIASVTEWGLEGWSGDDPDNRIDEAMKKEGKR